MVNILVYLFIYCFSFLLLEILKRKNILSSNSTRRIIHLGAAIIACTLPLYLTLFKILILCSILFFIMVFSKKYSFLSHIHKVERKTWGEIFYPLGVMVAAVVFLPKNIDNFIIVILILGISDLMANIIGTNLGSKSFKIFKNKKTIGGSLAFFISAMIILLFFQVDPLISFFIALIASLVELFSPYGSDNLTVPVFTSIFLILFT